MATIIKTKKAKPKYILWLVLFGAGIIIGYYLSGLYKVQNLTLNNLEMHLGDIFTHPFRDYYNEKSNLCMMAGGCIVFVFFSYYLSYLKNYMPGKEYGSAQWADIKKFNKLLEDAKQTDNNMILTRLARKSYDGVKTLLNNNVTVIGGSGAGKTAGCIAPNLLQNHGSNVYTDPKGDTLKDFGTALADKGVRILVLNLCEMEKSNGYNPFNYIHSTKNLTQLITNLIANTTPTSSVKGDPFWEKAETLYLQALFSFVWEECSEHVPYVKYTQERINEDSQLIIRNDITQFGAIYQTPVYEDKDLKRPVYLKKSFRSVLRLLTEAEVSDDESTHSPLDCRMRILEDRVVFKEGKLSEDNFTLSNYYKCIRGAGDTVRSIIISANARFAPFGSEELLAILDNDEMDLPSLGIGINGDEKTRTALFCVIPDDDTTFNFVPGMLYTQLFQELYSTARLYGGKLPLDVGFWFDEFANIKMPSDFPKILSTCRSRKMYIIIFLQSLAQIKALYKDEWEGLIGNCDTILYLGGNEQSSHKYVSELLGKWTIDKRSFNESKGRNGNTTRNYDILGRELMTPDEVKNMANEKSICFVRGQDPIYDNKLYWFQAKEYENIKQLAPFEYDVIQNKRYSMELLDPKGLAYYKHLEKSGSGVKVYSIPYEEFLLMDMKGEKQEIVLQSIEAIVKRNQSKIEEARQYAENVIADTKLDELEQKTKVKQHDGKKFESVSLLDVIKERVMELNDEKIALINEALETGVQEELIKEMVIENYSLKKMQLMCKISTNGMRKDG